MKVKKSKRYLLIYIFLAVFFLAAVFSLFSLQIVNGEKNRALSDNSLSLKTVIKAERGDICDRYGRELVTNKTGYFVEFNKTAKGKKEQEAELLSLYAFLGEPKTEEDIQKALAESGFSATNPYVVIENADIETITKIKENKTLFESVKIVERPVREYLYPETAVHILGRVGLVSKNEYEELSKKGYKRNDYVGKQGAEKAFESYLKGTDGIKSAEKSLGFYDTEFIKEKEAKAGNTVMLTIDLDVQTATEDALKDALEDKKSGGAAVVLDVNTGEVLASASYPDFNIEEFNKNYENLAKDKKKPMFNRALSGLFEPGSTFKPVSSIAAIDSGVITPSAKISTKGKYKLSDHTFLCNIYKKQGKTHGTIDVTDALAKSCNYFFFETAKRSGIDAISDTAESFGLGEKTGIELLEEASGKIASKEKREKNGGVWYPGDTLQAAIGQSDNLFTPIALANYAAALANGGNVYKTTILKAVKNKESNEIIKTNEPKIKNVAPASKTALSAVKSGMQKVCQKGGTAETVFLNFPISVAGKTGSAQVSGGTNGLFICYAPAENPQIAVSVVLEGGDSGTFAAQAARKILEAYFKKPQENNEITEEEGYFKLLP